MARASGAISTVHALWHALFRCAGLPCACTTADNIALCLLPARHACNRQCSASSAVLDACGHKRSLAGSCINPSVSVAATCQQSVCCGHQGNANLVMFACGQPYATGLARSQLWMNPEQSSILLHAVEMCWCHTNVIGCVHMLAGANHSHQSQKVSHRPHGTCCAQS